MKGSFRVFDAHAHLGCALHSGRVHREEDLLSAMDRAGVDRTLLIPFPVVRNYRREHDLIAGAARRHPGRFVGAACLDPYVGAQAYGEEVRRCHEVHGFRALKFQPQYQGLNPLSGRSDFLFEAALAHDLTLVCHTGSGAPFALPSLYIHAARRFPELRIVLAHAGGSVYFHEAIVAASVCPNIYIELSTLPPHCVLEILDHVAPDRLMVGSDLPESLDTEIGKILGLGIPDEAKRAILWDTAATLFPVAGHGAG